MPITHGRIVGDDFWACDVSWGEDTYWAATWWRENRADEDAMVILLNRIDDKFYVSPAAFYSADDTSRDIGPYETLEEAAAAMVLIQRMAGGSE